MKLEPELEPKMVVVRLRSGQSEFADKFLQALGHLLVLSNDLEDALGDVYSVATGKSLAQSDDELRGLTLGPLIARVTEAYEKRFPDGEQHERLEKLKPRLKEALDHRNAFVHARWVHVPAYEQVERTRFPRGEKGSWETLMLNVADVETAIAVVGDVAEQVTAELRAPILRESFRRYMERHPG